MASQLVTDCAIAIAEKGWKIAFVESATAGRMCAEFALTPSSGMILRGGISCYEFFVKEQLLHIPKAVIEKYTAESAEVTSLLAKGGAKLFNTAITVAITGLTSPGGTETKQKPVGTMFINIIAKGREIAHREIFKGTPEEIILQAIDKAAGLIIKEIATINLSS